MKLKDGLNKLTDELEKKQQLGDDRAFAQEQTARIIEALAAAAGHILENIDQTKEFTVKNDVLGIDSPKFDDMTKALKEIIVIGRANAPKDQQPLVEAMDRATKAIQSLPEPQKIEIPKPIDYNPSFRHLAGQLEKLNKKDFSPVFEPQITVEPAKVELEVDIESLAQAQRDTNKKLDAVIDYLSKTPVLPVGELMFLFKDMQESLDILAKRPQVVGPSGGGGTGGSAPSGPDVYDTATYGSGTYS